jgi:L-alanine-DL-glutamate epimerase-like enolase superfamily enzyme
VIPTWCAGSYALPIIADESCVTEDDFLRVAMYFDGINVKLVKCGGLTPALRILRRAKGHGLRTMVGCMLETSVLIAAGCVAAQIAEYADLDGAWLIA